MKETLLSVEELAKYLQLNEQTIYRKVDSGEIPSVRLGGAIRFRQEDIDKWLTKRTKGGKN